MRPLLPAGKTALIVSAVVLVLALGVLVYVVHTFHSAPASTPVPSAPPGQP